MTLHNARHVGIKILAHRRSRIAGKGQALVITGGDSLYFMFIDVLKFQISNLNNQTNPNNRNSNIQTMSSWKVLVIA